MFPNRFHAELGSGEAINEMITGTGWPAKTERNERLLTCAAIIRDLLHGKEYRYQGPVDTVPLRLYTLPEQPPALFCAAISDKTAAWAGRWADGLLTIADGPEQVKKRMELFYETAATEKPVYVQLSFSYDTSKDEALAGAWVQWKTNMLPPDQLADLYTPEQFEAATKHITMQDVAEKMNIFTNIMELQQLIDAYKRIGVARIILHNVNEKQEQFIEAYSTLPH
jgi:G6PDH family F420-dependent oxidoreductase